MHTGMKRLFDCILAVTLALALAIPMLLLAALIRLTSKGPALYWSDRVGAGQHPIQDAQIQEHENRHPGYRNALA